MATKDVGINKSGEMKDTFTRGIELVGRQTLFAEGCRGSCSEEVIRNFDLREGKDVQSYGLGIKEVWEVPEDQIQAGFIQHTVGWPLQDGLMSDTFGGTFLYHQKPNLVLLGMVVGLDYKNPYLNPYKEFQSWKHHPGNQDEILLFDMQLLISSLFNRYLKHAYMCTYLTSQRFRSIWKTEHAFHMVPGV